MLVTSSGVLSLLALLSVPGVLALPGPRAKRQQENAQTSLTLDPNVIQPGLANDGQDVPAAGQVPSLTSTNNFINFCLTQNVPLTNGQQVREGSCNPIAMGRIPAVDKIPSCKFVFPKNGENSIVENAPFQVQLQIKNLQAGFFTNAQATYYAAPQQLNGDGVITGHSHVVIEKLSSLDQTDITNPLDFVFFKGINTGAVNGILTADVTKGLPAGFYRIATINGANNHQPVLAPIAQHGSMDDHAYFTVIPAGAPAPPPENGDAGADLPPPNAGAAPTPPPAADNGAAAPPPPPVQNGNLQQFGESLGDVPAPPIIQQGDQFVTDGAQFNDLAAAVERSCNTQRNQCADKGNATGFQNGVTIGACDAQRTACVALTAERAPDGAQNLNAFNGSLGSPAIPIQQAQDGGFLADNAKFANKDGARQRACDAQRNACADAANEAQFQNGLTIEACDAQRAQCLQTPVL